MLCRYYSRTGGKDSQSERDLDHIEKKNCVVLGVKMRGGIENLKETEA